MKQELIDKMKAARLAAGPRKSTAITHTVRAKDGGTVTFKNYTRAMADRIGCTECLGWEGDPKDCTSPLCPHFPFRKRTLATQHGDSVQK